MAHLLAKEVRSITGIFFGLVLFTILCYWAPYGVFALFVGWPNTLPITVIIGLPVGLVGLILRIIPPRKTAPELHFYENSVLHLAIIMGLLPLVRCAIVGSEMSALGNMDFILLGVFITLFGFLFWVGALFHDYHGEPVTH